MEMTERTQAEKVTYWTTGYNYWRAKMGTLAISEGYGEPQSFEDSPVPGFYRKAIMEKVPNKRAKRIGWEPVAVFRHENQITGALGDRTLTGDELLGIWTHICGNPISEDWYRAVAERGEPWPDSHEADASSFTQDDKSGKPLASADVSQPQDKIAAGLAECEALLPKYATIDSDEVSSKARSLQNRFLDLRGDAKREYDRLNDPLLEEQKRIRAIFFPLRDRADEAAKRLRAAMESHEDEKRRAAKRAEDAARKAALAHAEAAEKAAEQGKPPPPPPMVEKPNTEAPAAQIRGGAGRAASVRVETIVTHIDVMMAAEFFKEKGELREFLMAMAQKAIRAGISVPGAVTEEKSIIR
jgi:hypothetical protein